MPERIQRKRTRGWRMPENTVSVCRPGKWGNPFVPGTKVAPTAEEAVELYARYLRHTVGESGWTLEEEARRELRGKNLACWCPPVMPCHAEVLLRIANEEPLRFRSVRTGVG